MSRRTDYNGWHNRATWNVALWADNDYNSYQYVQSQKPYNIAKAKRVAQDLFGDATPDGCKLANVKWSEIVSAWNE
jgi:hypothetical protein